MRRAVADGVNIVERSATERVNVDPVAARSARRDQRAASTAALLDTFATQRRDDGDVFWMKENAEILNILECTGQDVLESALGVYGEFYATIEERLEFFPQYYRFLLSICQDLESLGLKGGKSHRLAQWIADQGLVEAELSDLQRGEAMRLLTRNGITTMRDVTPIGDRLKSFAGRAATFSVPNKKAAYELTHIVFYLSQYGKCDPELGEDVLKSLEFCGTMAFLDCNFDLLAEVLVALTYCDAPVPQIWRDAVVRNTANFMVSEGDEAVMQDDYHEYLVCNWALSAIGQKSFQAPLRPGPVSFHAAPRDADTALPRQVQAAIRALTAR